MSKEYIDALEGKISDHRNMLFIVFGGIAAAEDFTGRERLLDLLEQHLGVQGMADALQRCTHTRREALTRVLRVIGPGGPIND